MVAQRKVVCLQARGLDDSYANHFDFFTFPFSLRFLSSPVSLAAPKPTPLFLI